MTHHRPLKSITPKSAVADVSVLGVSPALVARALEQKESVKEGWGGNISRVLKPPLG